MLGVLNKFFDSVINGFMLRGVNKDDCVVHGRIFVINEGSIVFGRGIKINSGFKFNPIGFGSRTTIKVKKNGILKIGENVGMSNVSIYCSSKITIGNNVLLGGGVKIWDTNFHSLNVKDRLSGDTNIISKPVFIKDGAFIGGGVLIQKGCIIGTNSIIAAGSIVSKDIPDNEIWGGNPARFIRKNR